MKENAIVQELEQCLKEHDWYYSFSDDHRYWSRGFSQRKHIFSLKEQLNDDKLFDELYKKYAPND